VSFVAITLRVASQRVFVVVYFVMDLVQKFWLHPPMYLTIFIGLVHHKVILCCNSISHACREEWMPAARFCICNWVAWGTTHHTTWGVRQHEYVLQFEPRDSNVTTSVSNLSSSSSLFNGEFRWYDAGVPCWLVEVMSGFIPCQYIIRAIKSSRMLGEIYSTHGEMRNP
jgi:hypothetical protein